jgi:hypothetical protein
VLSVDEMLKSTAVATVRASFWTSLNQALDICRKNDGRTLTIYDASVCIDSFDRKFKLNSIFGEQVRLTKFERKNTILDISTPAPEKAICLHLLRSWTKSMIVPGSQLLKLVLIVILQMCPILSRSYGYDILVCWKYRSTNIISRICSMDSALFDHVCSIVYKVSGILCQFKNKTLKDSHINPCIQIE